MSETNSEGSGGFKIDLAGFVKAHGQTALVAAVIVGVLVAVFGFLYLKWGQSVSRITALEFRPTFSGAALLQYPNKLPFSTNDVIATSVLDSVFDVGDIKQYCSREAFRGGFFVERRSDQSVFLDLQYKALLSEPRIDAVQRRALAEEHAAKRLALPMQFRLVFIRPRNCSAIPDTVVAKAMTDVLATWAAESENQRGVLNYQIQVLSPATLDVTSEGPGGWVVGVDLLRTALERVIQNVDDVAKIPGAVLVRMGEKKLTFLELRGKLGDLLSARLEPLVMTSGRSLARDSFVWINEALLSAVRDEDAAKAAALVYLRALDGFAGRSQGIDSDRPTVGPSAAGAQTALMPQIDKSIVDRIVELSSGNAVFRQQLTKDMVEADLAAVRAGNRARYYRRLLQAFRESGGPAITSEELAKRLEEIKTEGKKLTEDFGKLYDEFSKVALRPAAGLYQVEKPVTFEENRSFTGRTFIQLVAVAFFGTLLLTLAFLLVRDRMSLERRWT